MADIASELVSNELLDCTWATQALPAHCSALPMLPPPPRTYARAPRQVREWPAKTGRGPFSMPDANELDAARKSLVQRFAGQPIWGLWCDGHLARYFLGRWAQQESPILQAVMRFALRCEGLLHADMPEAKRSCRGLLKDVKIQGAVDDIDKGELKDTISNCCVTGMVTSTNSTPYDAPLFISSVQPLLQLLNLPKDALTCDAFLASPYADELLRAQHVAAIQPRADDFVTRRLLGRGAYGMVELSFRADSGQPMALKRQHLACLADKGRGERALLEWQILTRVRSPFLLDATAAFRHGPDLVLALRYMAGGDLAFHLKRAQRQNDGAGFSTEVVQFYLASCVLALEALHAHGFVFRDLKDRNVLLDERGHARLGDFGLAADVSKGPASGGYGTEGFMAPEQLSSGATYTTEPDWWALGVCAYHWTVGKKPFHSRDARELKKMIQEANFNLTRMPNDQPLVSLVAGLLTTEPSRRLGVKSAFTLRDHKFFQRPGLSGEWGKLTLGLLPAPLKPADGCINAPTPEKIKKKSLAQPAIIDRLRLSGLRQSTERRFAGWSATNLDASEQALVEFLERCPDGLNPRAGRRSSRTPSDAGKPSPVRQRLVCVCMPALPASRYSRFPPAVQARKYSHTMMADLRTSKALQELNQEMCDDSKPKSNVSACCVIL